MRLRLFTDSYIWLVTLQCQIGVRILFCVKNKECLYTSVDFGRTYDSVDTEILFNTLEEFGTDYKTVAITKQALTNTKSKIKFCGKILKSFEIKTGVSQRDGLSPLSYSTSYWKRL